LSLEQLQQESRKEDQAREEEAHEPQTGSAWTPHLPSQP
jgi:hypothetical protein